MLGMPRSFLISKQETLVSWRTWPAGNINPQLLSQALGNRGSREMMRFCVPYVKPGRPLRKSHFQNKIEGLSVTMCYNLECSYSANTEE